MFNAILQVDAQRFFLVFFFLFLTDAFLSQGATHLLRLMKSAAFSVYLV